MWAAAPSSGSTRGGINYGIPHDFGMVGVRDVFLVAPASSFLQAQQPDHALLSSSDPNSGSYYVKKPLVIDYNNNNSSNNSTFITATVDGDGVANSSGSATCQDCGNQAKRDCTHRRCRTCCKSRGYDCNTHVKSTWVPAARRRERQLMVGSGGTGTSSASTSGGGGGSKKPRLVTSQQTTTTSYTSNSNNTPPRSFETSSSHQDASFKEKMPGHVRAPAVFKCVRVTSMDDGDDEYAYQAMVNIGGHIFKGFLYDQGEETKYPNEFPNISELHLGGASGKNAGTSSSPMLDDIFGTTTGSGGLLGNSNFGNHINL